MTQTPLEGKPCAQCQKDLLPYCVCDHPDFKESDDGLDDLDYDGKTTEEIFAEMPWTEADEAALEQYEEDRRRRIAEQNEY